VPGVLNTIADEKPPAGTSSATNADGMEPDVTVCAMLSTDFHCTMLPALTVVFTLVAPTYQSITVAPVAGTVGLVDPLAPEPPHADSTAMIEPRRGKAASRKGRFVSRVMARGLRQLQSYSQVLRGAPDRNRKAARRDARVSGRGPVPDSTTPLPIENSWTRSFEEEVALDHQPVLYPDEEERRTLDLQLIQADGEREGGAQPASAASELDGPSRGSFKPLAVPLTEQYGCSTS